MSSRPDRTNTRLGPPTVGAVFVLLLLAGWPGQAARTDPALSLTSVTAEVGGGGVLVRFDGAIVGGTDMVQHAYPLQLLLFSSNGDYLRFDLTSGGFSGNNGALSDGLSAADAAVLLGEGTADPSPVLVFLSANRIDLRIGDAPPAGPATAVLFVLDEEGILLSNSVPVTLPAVAAP